MRARPVLLVLAALAAACAPPGAHCARAAADAGTQSVFAYGAGNRALALGGAYVAAADDASSIFWNPAGLAVASRSQFEAVQSGDLGVGFRETFGAVALPSWRWGTVALAVRHFGVGGIEQRDDRNVVIPGELTDSELEAVLGYARTFGTGWDVGAAFKTQRQGIGEFAGSGFGADVGVRLRLGQALGSESGWLRPWRLGLSVRNALQPSIRLDQDVVPDPTTVRAGLAWTSPVRLGSVLAEADVERTRGVSPRLHAGFEYAPVPGTALRAGLDGDHVTAGLGVRWQDVAFNYVFEDGTLAAAHRVGISLMFGRTTDESRAAAGRAEDDLLQRRMADALRDRQAAHVALLLARADSSTRAGHFDDALEALAAASTLTPDDARVTAGQARCLRARAAGLERAGDYAAAAMTYELALATGIRDTAAVAGAARCREASDQNARRTEALRQRFAGAVEALASGDLALARAGFAAVLAAQPGDRDAQQMQQRTDAAIARRVAGQLAQAGRFVRDGLPKDARQALDAAAALDSTAAGLAEVRAQLTRLVLAQVDAGRAAARAEVAPAPVARVPAAARLDARELDALYRHGIEAARAQRSDDAVRYWELVWTASPDYRGVGENLKREYFARGMEAFAAGRLADAVDQWERVLRISPNDIRARGYLARAQQQMARSREILGANP